MAGFADIRTRVRISLALFFLLPLVGLATAFENSIASSATVVAIAAIWLPFWLVLRCDLTGYWFRFGLLGMMLSAIALRFGITGLITAAALTMALWLLLRTKPRSTAILDLAFPLRGGIYCVGQGGAHSAINHHFQNPSQRYALDLVQIHWTGFSARRVLPHDLAEYVYFGKPVYSPCGGLVTAVSDGIEDLSPPLCTPAQPAGNHVVIQVAGCDVFVGLAHLQSGSILVRAGDRVVAGQMIGKIGNSGNSSEPHLHIHAKTRGRPDSMLDGSGVPLTFRTRWLVRNSVRWGHADTNSKSKQRFG